MQGAVRLRAGLAEQGEHDGIQVDAAVTVSVRTGKLEVRLRRGIERMSPRCGRRTVLRDELKVDTELLGARERGCQRAGSLTLAHRLLPLLFADRTGSAGYDAHG